MGERKGREEEGENREGREREGREEGGERRGREKREGREEERRSMRRDNDLATDQVCSYECSMTHQKISYREKPDGGMALLHLKCTHVQHYKEDNGESEGKLCRHF